MLDLVRSLKMKSVIEKCFLAQIDFDLTVLINSEQMLAHARGTVMNVASSHYCRSFPFLASPSFRTENERSIKIDHHTNVNSITNTFRVKIVTFTNVRVFYAYVETRKKIQFTIYNIICLSKINGILLQDRR